MSHADRRSRWTSRRRCSSMDSTARGSSCSPAEPPYDALKRHGAHLDWGTDARSWSVFMVEVGVRYAHPLRAGTRAPDPDLSVQNDETAISGLPEGRAGRQSSPRGAVDVSPWPPVFRCASSNTGCGLGGRRRQPWRGDRTARRRAYHRGERMLGTVAVGVLAGLRLHEVDQALGLPPREAEHRLARLREELDRGGPRIRASGLSAYHVGQLVALRRALGIWK